MDLDLDLAWGLGVCACRAGGGAKLKAIGWLGEKYNYLLRKSAKIRRKRWKKRKFSMYLKGKMIIFGNRGRGKNIIFWANIDPCL